MDRTLCSILKRVDGVEDAIGTVAGSIGKILEELSVMGGTFRAHLAVRPAGNTVHVQSPHTNVETSYPSDWHQCMSQSNAADMVEVVRTPNAPEKSTPQQQMKPPAPQANRPILVDLDNTSDQSGENGAAGDFRRRTPESQVKRVHNQPRLRVVPCAKKVLGVASTAATADTTAEASPDPTLYRPRYKDPPGYSDARDFGGTGETPYKPPLLQPKNHGVSELPPPRSRSVLVRDAL